MNESKSAGPCCSALIAVLLIAFFSGPPCALAASGLLEGKAGKKDSGPWKITADTLVYEEKTRIYFASGGVLIEKDGSELHADRVRVNRKTMKAAAEGNVVLKSGGDYIEGSKMTLDLDSGTGTVTSGMIFLEKKHFYIRGDKILKTGKRSYRIDYGSLTSCDGKNPDWKITGHDLDVKMGGFGTVKHAALWAKKMPVAYLPYFVFPVRRERQSGFLTPEISYSDRNGLQWNQPFFWEISRSMDATFYYHRIENRGEKIGGEFRYAISPWSKGTLMFDSMHDEKVDDGEPSNSEWGYTDDQYLRSNTDRYWFRMKADQELPWDMDAQLDLDIVSDQDYLREFDDGLTGYSTADDYFESEFGRDLDDEDDPIRENRLNIKKISRLYSLNADVIWYDNVVKRRWEDYHDTVQQLPAVTLDVLKQPVGSSPFYVRADTEYVNFYRRDGVRSQRLDIHPRVYLPLRLEPYFTFEPSVGVRQTSWYIDPQDSRQEPWKGDEEVEHRQFYDLEAVLTTDLYRIYNKNKPGETAMKHTFIPELRYEYIPDTDQSEYPDFDMVDRLEDANRLTFSLTNLLTSKYFIKGRSGSGRSTDPGRTARYNRFLRFLIEQSYDFNHDKDSYEGLRREEYDENEPFEPLYAELDLTPVDLLTLRAEAEWSHEKDSLLSHLLSADLHNERGDRLSIEYRYDRDSRQSIDLGFGLKVTDRIRVSGVYERNLETGEDIERQLQLVYRSQCWSAGVVYTDDETDQEYSFIINLHGLGWIGNNI